MLLILSFLISCEKQKNNKVFQAPNKNLEKPKNIAQKPKKNSFEYYVFLRDSIIKNSADTLVYKKVFRDTILESRIYVAVFKGDIFNTGKKHTVAFFPTSDSDYELTFYEKQNSEWKLKWNKSITIDDGFVRNSDDLISFEHLNNDKHIDMEIVTFMHMIVGEKSKGFLFKENDLIEIKGFADLANPFYDKKTNKIYNYMSGGCADMIMGFMIGTIKSDSIFVEKEISCNCCLEKEINKCEITINNQKPFKVNKKYAYKYVPPVYQQSIKEKLRDF